MAIDMINKYNFGGEEELSAMKEEIALRPCPAGHEAMMTYPSLWEVYVVRCIKDGCWKGPIRDTERGAANAWNRREDEEEDGKTTDTN